MALLSQIWPARASSPPRGLLLGTRRGSQVAAGRVGAARSPCWGRLRAAPVLGGYRDRLRGGRCGPALWTGLARSRLGRLVGGPRRGTRLGRLVGGPRRGTRLGRLVVGPVGGRGWGVWLVGPVGGRGWGVWLVGPVGGRGWGVWLVGPVGGRGWGAGVVVRLLYALTDRDSRRIMYARMLKRLKSSRIEQSLPLVRYLRSENVLSISSRPPKIPKSGSASGMGRSALVRRVWGFWLISSGVLFSRTVVVAPCKLLGTLG